MQELIERSLDLECSPDLRPKSGPSNGGIPKRHPLKLVKPVDPGLCKRKSIGGLQMPDHVVVLCFYTIKHHIRNLVGKIKFRTKEEAGIDYSFSLAIETEQV